MDLISITLITFTLLPYTKWIDKNSNHVNQLNNIPSNFQSLNHLKLSSVEIGLAFTDFTVSNIYALIQLLNDEDNAARLTNFNLTELSRYFCFKKKVSIFKKIKNLLVYNVIFMLNRLFVVCMLQRVACTYDLYNPTMCKIETQWKQQNLVWSSSYKRQECF